MRAIQADIVIVGAGLLGSSAAMHLARQGARSVAVVDLDLEGSFSSSELNAGGVRATWNNPVNAAISKVSIDYYSRVAVEIGFRQNGYLWMYSREGWEGARSALQANANLGDLGIEYLSPREITARFPFIDKTGDLGGATFSPKDGLLNPNLLKSHYRRQARTAGARFEDGLWVHHVQLSGERTGHIEMQAWGWPGQIDHDEVKRILTVPEEKERILSGQRPTGAEPVAISCAALVNCSGAWARRFAHCMGIECPSMPLRRQVSIFECRGVDLARHGMFVDSTGVYFHAEAGNLLGGYATPDEIPGYNFEYDGEKFFNEYVWPALLNRSSKFEQLKHVTGWAGLYEISPDKSAIVGRVPGFQNVYEAHSFSGRGAMQSYGAGLGLGELILSGGFQSIDLAALSGDRFASGHLLSEGLLI